jgi:hypothetical protein
MFEDLTLNLSHSIVICHKTKPLQEDPQTLEKLSSSFCLLGVLQSKVSTKLLSFSMHKTSFFLVSTQCSFSYLVWAHNLLETTRKQTRFETPKFNKICNCIKMTRKEITWVEGVANYNHKTTTCSKLTSNSKFSRCTQKLDRRE